MDFNVMRYKKFVHVVSNFTCQLTFSAIYRLVVSKSSQLFERLLTISPFSKYLPVKIQVASLLKPKQHITTGQIKKWVWEYSLSSIKPDIKEFCKTVEQPLSYN